MLGNVLWLLAALYVFIGSVWATNFITDDLDLSNVSWQCIPAAAVLVVLWPIAMVRTKRFW